MARIRFTVDNKEFCWDEDKKCLLEYPGNEISLRRDEKTLLSIFFGKRNRWVSHREIRDAIEVTDIASFISHLRQKVGLPGRNKFLQTRNHEYSFRPQAYNVLDGLDPDFLDKSPTLAISFPHTVGAPNAPQTFRGHGFEALNEAVAHGMVAGAANAESNRVTPARLLKPNSSSFFARARGYLRGGAPDFDTAYHIGVPRNNALARLRNRLDAGSNLILVSAAIGDGLTTFLMQYCAEVIREAPDALVYYYIGDCLPDCPPSTLPHILVVDDLHRVERGQLPRWLKTYGAALTKGSVAVLGVRQYAKHRYVAQMPDVAMMELGEVGSPVEYVQRIRDYNAGDRPDADIEGLFVDGLSGGERPNESGLFPAMYAATRGEALEERFSRIVVSYGTSSRKLDAVALMTFLNNMHYWTDGLFELPTAALLKQAARRIANNEDQPVDAVTWLEDNWRGEFRWSPGQRMEIRHPSITHILFRSIFGASRKRRGEVLLEKWEFYRVIGELLLANSATSQFITLMNNAVSLLWYDRKQKLHVDEKAAARLVLDMLKGEFRGFSKSQLTSLALARADVCVFLASWRSKTRTDEQGAVLSEEQRKLQAEALLAIGRAADMSIDNARGLSRASDILKRLPGSSSQNLIATRDKRAFDWHELMQHALDVAEAAGSSSLANDIRRNYLTILVRDVNRGTDWTASKEPLLKAIEIATLLGFGHTVATLDQRDFGLLVGLARMTRYPFHNWSLEPGGYDDKFGDTKRSIYGCVWRQLKIHHGRGKLADLLSTDAAQFKAFANDWLKFEIELSDTNTTPPIVIAALDDENWHTLAELYPKRSSGILTSVQGVLS